MEKKIFYNPLQLREIFHLEFLRWFGRKIRADYYALKGGVNLRFFFNSFRYSEDMDLDVQNVKVDILRDTVTKILKAVSFQESLKPFGIERVIPPDITKAKQTQTMQRFEVHLITPAGEDFYTKIEFSRRGFKGNRIVESISNIILRKYKLTPLLVPHYDMISTVTQKIEALATRALIQVRDIFDLYMLSSQFNFSGREEVKLSNAKIKKAYENIFEISYEQFCDTVVSYLPKEDQEIYNTQSLWDEIKLKTANFIEELQR